MTGWFNIVGLIGIVASVAYGAAFFLDTLLGLYGVNIFGVNFGDDAHVLSETFLLFLIILAFVTILNIFADPLLALLNNISVGWHVLGVAVIIGLLDLRARQPPGRRLRLRRAAQQHRASTAVAHRQPCRSGSWCCRWDSC